MTNPTNQDPWEDILRGFDIINETAALAGMRLRTLLAEGAAPTVPQGPIQVGHCAECRQTFFAAALVELAPSPTNTRGQGIGFPVKVCPTCAKRLGAIGFCEDCNMPEDECTCNVSLISTPIMKEAFGLDSQEREYFFTWCAEKAHSLGGEAIETEEPITKGDLVFMWNSLSTWIEGHGFDENPKRDIPVPLAVQALRKWREAESRARQVPSYVVMPNATLYAIAAALPDTIEGLRSIRGMGNQRADTFGAAILEAIENAPSLLHNEPRMVIQEGASA